MTAPVAPLDDTALAATQAAAVHTAPASLPPSGVSPEDDGEPRPAEVPGYRLLRFLGRGAFGAVWLALQENTGKQVAIKFYARAAAVDLDMVRHEVEKLATLYTAREIVQLIEVGWDAEPPYFVMEYLEHGSLEERLRQKPLPLPEALHIFKAMARALAQAHGHGILHCDLKPGNVMLDGGMRPRLGDFGQSRLTSEGTPSLGTFFYMAPEQARLDAVPDARWDVYALGAIFVAMLTGEPPYRTEASKRCLGASTALPERLARYRQLVADAASPVEALRPLGVDAGLRELIGRCLARSPEERYPSVQAVLDALEALAARRARRPLIILGAVGPALLLLLMLLVGWQVTRTALSASTAAITGRALEGCRFAARFVAETASREVDRRWGALEEAAADPALRTTLADLDQLEGEPGLERRLMGELQTVIEKLAEQHRTMGATSWFISDANGIQRARTPRSATVGQSWAFRDYFHGRGHDLPPEKVPDDIEPIRQPYRSMVFDSRASGARAVAFSVPIHGQGGGEIIGVLGMTVELGRFGELHPGERSGARQLAVLVDVRPDWTGQRGLILQHPSLLQALDRHRPLPSSRLPPAWLDRLGQGGSDDNYVDPIWGRGAGRWLVAAEPVRARGHDTGWVAIVQEPYSEIINPVEELGARLRRLGYFGVGGVAVVLTLLWGIVMRSLSQTVPYGQRR